MKSYSELIRNIFYFKYTEVQIVCKLSDKADSNVIVIFYKVNSKQKSQFLYKSLIGIKLVYLNNLKPSSQESNFKN